MVSRGFTVAVEPPHSVRFSCRREVGGGRKRREKKGERGEKEGEERGRLSSSREKEGG